jgi:hypothetical protein
LTTILSEIQVEKGKSMTFLQLKSSFETDLENFELFWYSKPMDVLRKNGLLML